MKPERVLHLLELEKQYALKQRGFQQQPINKEVRQALDIAINAVGAIEQVRWERDTAIEQLNSYGVGLCENADVQKIVRCEKCAFAQKQIEFKNLYVCLQNERFVKKNDFCSYGERKTDNG